MRGVQRAAPTERIDALDGLRALAVLGVFLFHLGVPGCSLGWSGVNLFFVLSGFLITGLLRKSRNADGYLRSFYVRRTLRLFPIYYLTLAAVTAFALLTGRPIDDLPYYVTYTQNYLLGQRDFSPHFPNLMNHTWTLAIEEQFYLLWPLLVGTLRTPTLVRVLLSLLLVGPATRALALDLGWGPYTYFTPLPAQIDSLAFGALLSISRESAPGWTALPILRGGVLLTVGGLVCAVVILSSGINSYWSPALWTRRPESVLLFVGLEFLFGGFLQLALAPATRFQRALSGRTVRHLGRISYGLYMYHLPIFLLIDHVRLTRFPQLSSPTARLALDVLKVGLTYAVALASWTLLENPLRRLKDRIAPVSGGVPTSRESI